MRSLLLDANVLVLLIVGLVDRRSISSHKRCRQFTEVDFDLLVATIERFGPLVVTTSVLTEASNLLAQTHEALKRRLLAALGEFLRAALEERPESVAVVGERIFMRLGVTDAGLVSCVRSGHSLLTTDLDLYLTASALSDKVENFNHLNDTCCPDRAHRMPGLCLLTPRCQQPPRTMSTSHQRLQESLMEHRSAIDWFEIPVRDMDRAQAFYEALLATTIRRETIAPNQLGVFSAAETGVGGCLMAGESAPQPSANGTLIYLNAGASLDAVLARVEAAGGRITTPKVQLPGDMGVFAHIADTEGNRVGLHAPR